MKILLLDIETAPNIVPVWGLWNQNIQPSQILSAGYVLCWAAKWLGDRDMQYADGRTNHVKMLHEIHKLIQEADILVHYNGKKFDIPTLNKEFILFGLKPPKLPYIQIDLLMTARRAFRFPSNKMDYVCQALGLGKKVRHPGQEMWTACMDKKHPLHEQMWKKMEQYNRNDVRLLERLYRYLRPWFPSTSGFVRISEYLSGKRKIPK